MDSLGSATKPTTTAHTDGSTGVALVGEAATGETNGAVANSQESPAVIYLGGGLLQIGTMPLRLQGQEELVIEALVDLRAASKKELETKSGVADAVTVLRRIRDTHPCLKDRIILPGKKNAGGYHQCGDCKDFTVRHDERF